MACGVVKCGNEWLGGDVRNNKFLVGPGQEYHTKRGELKHYSTLTSKGNVEISANSIVGYLDKVYVSENIKFKPRALHGINRNIENAMKTFDIPMEKKPTIIVSTLDELGIWGKYDPVNNRVYLSYEISDEKKREGANGFIEYHEIWHMKQALFYELKHGKITHNNVNDYLLEAKYNAKRNIDVLGVNSYNVIKVSKNAWQKYMLASFDEVEADLIALLSTSEKAKLDGISKISRTSSKMGGFIYGIPIERFIG